MKWKIVCMPCSTPSLTLGSLTDMMDSVKKKPGAMSGLIMFVWIPIRGFRFYDRVLYIYSNGIGYTSTSFSSYMVEIRVRTCGSWVIHSPQV
jgi:hypothetical protein